MPRLLEVVARGHSSLRPSPTRSRPVPAPSRQRDHVLCAVEAILFFGPGSRTILSRLHQVANRLADAHLWGQIEDLRDRFDGRCVCVEVLRRACCHCSGVFGVLLFQESRAGRDARLCLVFASSLRGGLLDPHHSLGHHRGELRRGSSFPPDVRGGFLAARKANRQSVPGKKPTVGAMMSNELCFVADALRPQARCSRQLDRVR